MLASLASFVANTLKHHDEAVGTAVGAGGGAAVVIPSLPANAPWPAVVITAFLFTFGPLILGHFFRTKERSERDRRRDDVDAPKT